MERSFNFYYPTEAVFPELPHGVATVIFPYQDGRAEDVRILKSTGSLILDGALESQLERATFPKAYGLEKLQPHNFQFDIELDPSLTDFGNALKSSIAKQTVDNLNTPSTTDAGYVFIEFYYLDGKVLDPKVLHNSGDASVGDAVIHQLSRVKAPDPIPAIAGIKYRFILGLDRKSVV